MFIWLYIDNYHVNDSYCSKHNNWGQFVQKSSLWVLFIMFRIFFIDIVISTLMMMSSSKQCIHYIPFSYFVSPSPLNIFLWRKKHNTNITVELWSNEEKRANEPWPKFPSRYLWRNIKKEKICYWKLNSFHFETHGANAIRTSGIDYILASPAGKPPPWRNMDTFLYRPYQTWWQNPSGMDQTHPLQIPFLLSSHREDFTEYAKVLKTNLEDL